MYSARESIERNVEANNATVTSRDGLLSVFSNIRSHSPHASRKEPLVIGGDIPDNQHAVSHQSRKFPPRWLKDKTYIGVSNSSWVMCGVITLISIAIIIAIMIIGPKIHNHTDPNTVVLPNQHLIYPLDGDGKLDFVEFKLVAAYQKGMNVTVTPMQRNDGNSPWERIMSSVNPIYTAVQYEDNAQKTGSFNFHCSECTGPEYALAFSSNIDQPLVLTLHVVQLGPIGRAQVGIAGALLVLMYVGIVLEVMHRTLVALCGMWFTLLFLALLGKAPSLDKAAEWLDEGVITLLFGMMIIVAVMSHMGLFEWVAIRAYTLSRDRHWVLMVLLPTATAVLSAFLDNVTTMLLITPVTIRLAADLLKIDPVPLLMAECMMTNLGGTATMIGDPPNIIIGSRLSGHVQFLDFIVNLAPAVLLNYVVIMPYLLLHYRHHLRNPVHVDNLEGVKKEYGIKHRGLLIKTSILFSCVLILFFTEPLHHISVSWIALVGAVLMMIIATPREISEVLGDVEWDTLVFFCALFVMIEGLSEMGLIVWIGDNVNSWVEAAPPNQRLPVAILILIWVSGIVSAILDNIPYTATMVPVVTALASNPVLNLPIGPLVWALSLGACLGGNGTLVGASANIVTMGIASRHGHHVTFVQWLKVGMPVLGISLVVSTAYCMVVYVAAGFPG